jgi:NADH-quinone oxidoreductase subunit M
VFAEAPAGVAVLVAGSATRLGGYLLVRLLVAGQHDGATLLAPLLALMAAATAAYGGIAALGRQDIRRSAAYLALLPGAIAALGAAALTPLAVGGSVFMLFAGGLVAALMVGACATVAERAQTRSLALLGGLAARSPRLAWPFVLAALAVIGVPGMASFASELMVFLGSFKSQPAGAFGAGLGLLLAAASLAVLLYRVAFRPPNRDAPGTGEPSGAETWYLGVLAGALLYFGLIPGGPKIGGVPLPLDPGIVNVLGPAAADIAAPYVPGGGGP